MVSLNMCASMPWLQQWHRGQDNANGQENGTGQPSPFKITRGGEGTSTPCVPAWKPERIRPKVNPTHVHQPHDKATHRETGPPCAAEEHPIALAGGNDVICEQPSMDVGHAADAVRQLLHDDAEGIRQPLAVSDGADLGISSLLTAPAPSVAEEASHSKRRSPELPSAYAMLESSPSSYHNLLVVQTHPPPTKEKEKETVAEKHRACGTGIMLPESPRRGPCREQKTPARGREESQTAEANRGVKSPQHRTASAG